MRDGDVSWAKNNLCGLVVRKVEAGLLRILGHSDDNQGVKLFAL